MHPPAFRHSHYLSDWPSCGVEVICCRGTTVIPVKMLIRDHGDRTFEDLLSRLRGSRCRGGPKRAYLCAGHREYSGGAPADWAIELIAPRR
jgi:hypothetical protein